VVGQLARMPRLAVPRLVVIPEPSNGSLDCEFRAAPAASRSRSLSEFEASS
jgi:hypothetical protein